MNATFSLRGIFTLLLASAACAPAAPLDTAKIETLTGLKGTLNEAEHVFKVSAPRTDVKIAVDGWTMPPFMGLTTWAAFTPGLKAEAMVAGDLGRANALEGNVVLYKTVGGKRSSLDIVGRKGGYGVKASVAPKQWHTLRVEFSGDTFTVKWNGKELFQVKDATFTDAGKVGLWTKADSVTVFDDFNFGEK